MKFKEILGNLLSPKWKPLMCKYHGISFDCYWTCKGTANCHSDFENHVKNSMSRNHFLSRNHPVVSVGSIPEVKLLKFRAIFHLMR